ncbi:MAG: histone deacetylase family protein [Candidatus Helarchaeota archaeon]
MVRTGVIYDDLYLNHETGSHVESKERLIETKKLFEENKIFQKDGIVHVKPDPAPLDVIKLVHHDYYIEKVKDRCEAGGGWLDGDTITSRDSYETALFAVGGLTKAADLIMSKEINNAFGAVRPPGHHAGEGAARGFCLFNNVAILARYLLKRYDEIQKVLIVDHDVHAGNGTSYTFYNQPEVLLFNLHQHPQTLYPGTCYLDEIGEDKGKGYNVNMTVMPGTSDMEYINLIEELLIPIASQFEPDFVLVSAGFDAHHSDPLASVNLTLNGFKEIIQRVNEIAKKHCNGRLMITLEGGYNLNAVSKGILTEVCVLNGLSDFEFDDKKITASSQIQSYNLKLIQEAKDLFKPFWTFK